MPISKTARQVCAYAILFFLPCAAIPSQISIEDILVESSISGQYGGTLTVAQRAEPKTLNPLSSFDVSSREVIGRLNADLISINRHTLGTEPALARAWSVSNGGRVYTLKLRRGVRFSDGQPFDADDVVFTFQVYLDEKLHAPQRDLLIVGGRPISVRKISGDTVAVELTAPYAAAERLFDSIAILPRHLLEKAYRDGTLEHQWGLNANPAAIAGLGPFRLKEYRAGQSLLLERNPYYWKAGRDGRRLPYLDTLEFRFVGSEDAQVLRFASGDAGMLSSIGARNFTFLQSQAAMRSAHLVDAGPGLEYNFLFFNLNQPGNPPDSGLTQKQSWFRLEPFREAISAATDREAIVRLVYGGRAAPLWGPVTQGDRRWVNAALPHPSRSLEKSRHLLVGAGFRWDRGGALRDIGGHPVEFSILTSASNEERQQMAAILQSDLSQLGMKVQVIQLEFRALLDRILRTHRYEAAVFGLASGDADPNADVNVWLSSGGMHLWNLGESQPASAWEAEIDRLMRQQMSEAAFSRRKLLYDRVQLLIATHFPIICLASPDILAGAQGYVGNFLPAILEPYTLWNSERLYITETAGGHGSKLP